MVHHYITTSNLLTIKEKHKDDETNFYDRSIQDINKA